MLLVFVFTRLTVLELAVDAFVYGVARSSVTDAAYPVEWWLERDHRFDDMHAFGHRLSHRHLPSPALPFKMLV